MPVVNPELADRAPPRAADLFPSAYKKDFRTDRRDLGDVLHSRVSDPDHGLTTSAAQVRVIGRRRCRLAVESLWVRSTTHARGDQGLRRRREAAPQSERHARALCVYGRVFRLRSHLESSRWRERLEVMHPGLNPRRNRIGGGDGERSVLCRGVRSASRCLAVLRYSRGPDDVLLVSAHDSRRA